MAKSIAERYLKITVNPHSYLLTDESKIGIKEYIDTGNYALNCLISADPYKGIPSGRIIQFAGPYSTGKSFLSLETMKHAQEAGYTILYYDTEWGENKDNLVKNRGMDPAKFIHAPIANIPTLKTDILNLLEEIQPDEKLMIVVDSIGNLVTSKEYEDSSAGKTTKDLTKPGELKSLFRTITLPLGIKHVPMIVVNHVYDKIGSFFAEQEVAGGSGSKYLSSTLIRLTKAQEKDGTNVIGALITCKSEKNRLAKEKEKIKVVINYSTGYSRVTGLFDLALELGYLSNPKQGFYLIKDGDGKSLRKKDFIKTPEIWNEILDNGFADALRRKFAYQSNVPDDITEDTIIDLEGAVDVEDEVLEKELMRYDHSEIMGEPLT